MIETPEEVIGSIREDAAVARPAWVYYLAHPLTPRAPRYVGMTTDIAARAHSHTKCSGSSNAAIAAWKRELRLAGLTALLVPMASYASKQQAREAEWRLIQRWRRRGLCDLNDPRDGNARRWDAMWAARRARGAA